MFLKEKVLGSRRTADDDRAAASEASKSRAADPPLRVHRLVLRLY